MNLKILLIKGHFREVNGSLTQGSLTLIDLPGKGISTQEGLQIRGRSFKNEAGTVRIELYSPGLGFNFLPDIDECERVGIPVDSDLDIPHA